MFSTQHSSRWTKHERENFIIFYHSTILTSIFLVLVETEVKYCISTNKCTCSYKRTLSTLWVYELTDLQIRVRIGKLFSLFLIQNICCGYSKEPSQWDGSFERPKLMFKLIGKKIYSILRLYNFLIWIYDYKLISSQSSSAISILI